MAVNIRLMNRLLISIKMIKYNRCIMIVQNTLNSFKFFFFHFHQQGTVFVSHRDKFTITNTVLWQFFFLFFVLMEIRFDTNHVVFGKFKNMRAKQHTTIIKIWWLWYSLLLKIIIIIVKLSIQIKWNWMKNESNKSNKE